MSRIQKAALWLTYILFQCVIMTCNGLQASEGNAADHQLNKAHCTKGWFYTNRGAPDMESETTCSSHHDVIHVALVTCGGDRWEEALMMMKSAFLFSKAMIYFHVFSEINLQKIFRKEIQKIPQLKNGQLLYKIYAIHIPKRNIREEDNKPCATQRLYLPEMLLDVDRVLYVDTDILFLCPLEDIWAIFNQFNSSHLAAVAQEQEDASLSWYSRLAKHPYYHPLGLNSGVILMDLQRMRSVQWSNTVVGYSKDYKLIWVDQDLINIYFHFYPEHVIVLGCEYNYRPDHCTYGQVCRSASRQGAAVVHGSRRSFVKDSEVTFKAVYDTFKKFQIGKLSVAKLINRLQDNLKQIPIDSKSKCPRTTDVFIKQLQKEYQRERSYDSERVCCTGLVDFRGC